MISEIGLMTQQTLGHYIDDFLDQPEEKRERGVYIFYKHEPTHFQDILDAGYIYIILREPTMDKPGRIAIETRGLGIADVFSTTHASIGTYVQRDTGEGKTYEATLSLALSDPGRHYVLHGPSKVGKTQLWRAVLGPDGIPIACGGIKDIGELYAHAIYRLKKPYLVAENISISQQESQKSQRSASVGYEKILSLGLSASKSDQRLLERERQYAYDSQPRTAMVAAEAFAENKSFLVLENFHRLSSEVMQQLAMDLREFSDRRVSVILVGIPNDPYQLFDLNKELTGRIEYLEFTWWPVEDLKKIALAGGQVLNVNFKKESLDMLTRESSGSPLLMQQFCLIACLASDITECCDEEQEALVNISRDQLDRAIRRWVGNTLAPYSACRDIIKEIAKKVGLPESLENALFRSVKKRDPFMTVTFSEIEIQDKDKDRLVAFLEELEKIPRTQGLLAMRTGCDDITVCDPGFFVYARWLAE